MQRETENRRWHIPAETIKNWFSKWGLRLLPAVVGFALARTGILGRTGMMKGIYPFGASFAAAVPSGSGAAAIAGILLGFILPGSDAETLRCAASALAAAGIKWALAELKPIKESPFFSPAAAFAGVVLTGVVVTSSIGADISYDLAAYFAEGAMAAAGAYFFSVAIGCWQGNRYNCTGVQEIYCAAASLCIIAIPLCRISIFGFSPVSVALMVFVLAAAVRLGAAGGGSAGIALGVVMALADGRFSSLGVMAIAGLAAALFSPLGNIAASAVFAISCAVGVIASGEVDVYLLTEVAAASIAFPIIKAERLSFVFDVLEPSGSVRMAVRSESYISRRLMDAAQGLKDASRTVSEVSERLDRLDAPDANIACRQATASVCADCAISRFCWETSRGETQELFDSLSNILRRDGRLTRANTPEPLRSRCARWGEMSEAVNARYAEYVAGEGARHRVAQVRQAVAGQLKGCGQLLSELAEESARERMDSERTGTQAAEILEEYGVAAEDVSCVCRRDGSMALSMTLRQTDCFPEPEYDAEEILSDELGTSFSLSQVEREGDSMLVTMESRPEYCLTAGIAQHSRRGNRLCGDACKILTGVNGGSYLLLSDGMGTGGRAAVDAAMTCDLMTRLLTAGFGEKGAMELVNSAMQISSGEETLATLDCARVDMYTGQLTLSKAGAVPTYILKKGQVIELPADSLPLGIMGNADCRTVETSLEAGDIVVMTSDGAVTDGGQWLADELMRAQTDDVQRLARDLLSMALARCLPEDDDITIIVFRMDEHIEAAEDAAA